MTTTAYPGDNLVDLPAPSRVAPACEIANAPACEIANAPATAATGEIAGVAPLTAVTKEPRYVFIDGLRGIAAMAVVLYHLHYSPLSGALDRAIPHLMASFQFGFLGVQIFFVISGFVIAHSLRDMVLGPKAIGVFAIRRQLRLDPPYWAVAMLSLALWRVEMIVYPKTTAPLPGIGTLLLNLLYLHKIANLPEIVRVAWTLCIEIQFYLFFALLMWAAQRGRRAGEPSRFAVALVFISGIVSLGLASALAFIPGVALLAFDPNLQDGAWMAPYWCFFAGGVLCYWALRRAIPHAVFVAFIALMLISAVRHPWNVPLYVGVATTLAVYGVGLAGKLTTLLGGRVLQYLGRISYSLYLVHWPVKVVVLGFGVVLTHQNRAAAIGWCVVAVLVSVAAAHVLHVLVERPSMRWASSMKRIQGNAVKTCAVEGPVVAKAVAC